MLPDTLAKICTLSEMGLSFSVGVVTRNTGYYCETLGYPNASAPRVYSGRRSGEPRSLLEHIKSLQQDGDRFPASFFPAVYAPRSRPRTMSLKSAVHPSYVISSLQPTGIASAPDMTRIFIFFITPEVAHRKRDQNSAWTFSLQPLIRLGVPLALCNLLDPAVSTFFGYSLMWCTGCAGRVFLTNSHGLVPTYGLFSNWGYGRPGTVGHRAVVCHNR